MNQGIYFNLINLERVCQDRMVAGKDFFIDTEFDMTKLDTVEILSGDTIYSARRFGPQRNDKEEVQKYRFSCECGQKVGNDSLGEICLNCQTEVKKKDFGLDITGWIRLPIRVLTPIGVHLLKSAMTVRVSPSSSKKKDDSKKKTVPSFDKLKAGQPPFAKDDMYYLYNRFEQVISPYVKNKKKLELLLANKDALFTNLFPVISKRLRRFMITMNGDVPEIKADVMSTIYTKIISIVRLHDAAPLTTMCKRMIAKSFTNEIDELYQKLAIEANSDKEKVIKGEIYSTKNPYSARVLVEPDNESKLGRGDAVRTSYDIFRTIHKEKIMEILKDRYGYSTLKADRLTDANFLLSDNEKVILKEILHNDSFWIFINRPPSIDMSAIIAVEIIDLCEENICYINPIVCGLVRGDFDGDTFSVYVIPFPLKWRLSVACNPRRHSVTWNRKVSSAYGPINDHVVTTHMMLDGSEVEML